MIYYVLETVTSLRLSIFYTITTCNIKANFTLISAPLLPQFLLLNTLRVDCAVQTTQKACTSKNLQAKQLRSDQESRTTQHYMDLHRALCVTWKSCWKGWVSTKTRDGDLPKVAKKLRTVVKYSWVSNPFLSSCEALLGKSRTEHNKAATLAWLVVSPPLSRQQVFVRMFSRPKDFATNSDQTFAGLHEEVQFCYKIKFAGLDWNCNERSWRSKLNGKY